MVLWYLVLYAGPKKVLTGITVFDEHRMEVYFYDALFEGAAREDAVRKGGAMCNTPTWSRTRPHWISIGVDSKCQVTEQKLICDFAHLSFSIITETSKPLGLLIPKSAALLPKLHRVLT